MRRAVGDCCVCSLFANGNRCELPRVAFWGRFMFVSLERVPRTPGAFDAARLQSRRYLIAEPCRAGNPVLSVHQSDIIAYGRDLRDYLLHEFMREIGESAPRDDAFFMCDLPFWGAFCSGEVFL